VEREGIVLSSEQSPGGAYTTPGYYVADRYGVAQEGPFQTQSEAFAHLEGRASVTFLDEPVVAQLLQPFSPGLQRSLGSLTSRKDIMPGSIEDFERAEARTLRSLAAARGDDAQILLERLESIREAKAQLASLTKEADYHFDDPQATSDGFTSDLRHTSRSNWLAEIPIPGEVDPTMMVTAANTFFERTPEAVRSHWGEYVRQAHSAAVLACSVANAGPESYRAFMDSAERLHKVAVRRTATDTLQPWSVVLPAIDPQAHGPLGAPDTNPVNPAPGPIGNPLPLPGAAITDAFSMEDPASLGAAGSPAADTYGTVADTGFQDSSWEPNPDPLVAGRREGAQTTKDRKDEAWGSDLEDEQKRVDSKSDPDAADQAEKDRLDRERWVSSHEGAWAHDNESEGEDLAAERKRLKSAPIKDSAEEGDRISEEMRLDVKDNDLKRREHDASMRQGSAMFNYPRQSYADYLAAISDGAAVIPPSQYAGMAAAVSPVGQSAQRTAAQRRVVAIDASPLTGWAHDLHPEDTCGECGKHIFGTVHEADDGQVHISWRHDPDGKIECGSVSEHRTAAQHTAGRKYSPRAGMPGEAVEANRPWRPTHIYDPIGWDQFDPRPHPDSDPIQAGSPVMDRGWMSPPGPGGMRFVHVEDPYGNHQSVASKSIRRRTPLDDEKQAADLASERHRVDDESSAQHPYKSAEEDRLDRERSGLTWREDHGRLANRRQGADGQINTSDPEGADLGFSLAPGSDVGWSERTPDEAARSFGQLTEFPDTGPDRFDPPLPYQGARRTAEVGNSHYIDKRGDKYVIVQKGTGKVLSTHDSKEGAEKAFRGMIYGKYGSVQRTAEYHYIHEESPGDWVITQKGTGKVLSHHDSKAEAEDAFRAMMAHKYGSQRPARLAAKGLFLVAATGDERDEQLNSAVGPYSGPNNPNYPQVLSPAAWDLRKAGDPSDPEAFSSGVIVDQTGLHDPVSDLGTVPVQGYAVSPERPQGEMWPFTAPLVGSPPSGAAAVWDVPTPGMASQAETGTSYPQPR